MNTLPRLPRVQAHWRTGLSRHLQRPMGSVLLPLMMGMDQAGSLAKGSSLCGACTDVCPVKIPLADLLLELRHDQAMTRRGSLSERTAMATAAWAMRHPRVYRLCQKLMRLALLPLSKSGWVKSLPSLPGRWTSVKDFPLPARKSFLADRSDRKDHPERRPGNGP